MESFSVLLQYGAIEETAYSLDVDNLVHAVKRRNIEKIKSLLTKKYYNSQFINNERDRNGYSALHLAVDRGFLEIIDLLLTAGADINLSKGGGVRGGTPLYIAAYNGNVEAIKILL